MLTGLVAILRNLCYKTEKRCERCKRMKILLLSCCAPCCCAVIEKMARDGYDFAVAFYNPNIVPAAEYEKRREENRRLCEGRKIPFIELEYDNERWRNLIKGLENEPERGRRCDVCFLHAVKAGYGIRKGERF